jgi:xylose isomerase
MKVRHSIIAAFMGKTKDRFSEYGESKTPIEKINMVGQVKGVEGVEIIFPYECEDVDAVKKTLSDNNLVISAVNVNIKAEPNLVNGSSSVPDAIARHRAIEIIQQGKEMATQLGADKVTCCPLSDGYDYLFQLNYADAWKNMVAVFKTAAQYKPEIPLYLEYKSQETRVQCILDTVAKTICMIRDIDESNLGITIDYGHSIMVGESPAEAVCLAESSGIPYYIHVNDNNKKWDWDLIPASRNPWDYMEMFFYLKHFNYQGWLTADMSPIRLDYVNAFRRGVLATERIIKAVERLDQDNVLALMKSRKSLEIMEMLEAALFR